jgi:hypothetical protein
MQMAMRVSTGALSVAVAVAVGCGGSDKATAPTHGAIALSVGQALLLDSGRVATTLSLAAGAQYMIAVVNTTPSGTAAADFTLAGTGPDSAAASPAGASRPILPSAPPAPTQGNAIRFRVPPGAHHLGAGTPDPHLSMLEHDRELVHRLIARRGNPITSARDQAGRALRRAAVRAMTRSPGAGLGPATAPVRGTTGARVPGRISATVGDTSLVFVRNNIMGSCGDADTVMARTAYASRWLLVLEDVQSAYANQLDTFYTNTLAPEYDAKTYGEVTANFGDPLLIDDSLSSAGRVTVLFSPVLNTELQGVAGFVNPCDFFANNDAPATSDTAIRSNETEIFYGFVPDSGWPPQYWTLFIRSVAAHESKHIASFAQHFLDNAQNFEELWLEEATAQASAEIWIRQFAPEHWKGNNDFQASLGCELIPNSCGRIVPLDLSQSHFVWLYEFLSNVESESVIGPTTEAKYGGAWSFARWAADQSATTEAAFFKAIVDDPVHTGLANLAARTGQSPGTMMLDFYLAMATNDYGAGFAPASRLLTVPSWDQRDIYSRLNGGIPSFFTRPYPLVPRAVDSGTFSTTVLGLKGGGASIFQLNAVGSGSETITIETGAGGALPAGNAFRLGVVRVL